MYITLYNFKKFSQMLSYLMSTSVSTAFVLLGEMSSSIAKVLIM